jgi:radical SAM superfamily enzyme YgiQ (UPF0313 family)
MLVRPRSRCGWGYMWAPLAINLEYIAASVLDVTDEISIINQEFNKIPIEQHLREFQPDIFGVTMSATDHLTGLDLCKTAKAFDKKIVTAVGGYHPTAIPDELLDHDQIDIVARGESEITVREWLEKDADPEGILGLSYKDKKGKHIHNAERPCVPDLDTLKFPARHLRAGDECSMWTKKGERHRDQIHTSRGCWGKCTFCCEPSMSKSRQRFRTPENIMKEVLEVFELHHKEPSVIIWGDPHFMGKPSMVDKLCDKLIEADLDIIFTAMLRADTVARHPDIVAKMVKAGVVGYCMGIESPSEGNLKGTKKGISNKIQMQAVRTLRRNHGVAGGTFVIGLLGHTKEEILTFPEYARHLGMTNAAFAIATPQAGSEFYKELDSKGLIFERDWTLYDQMHLVYKHDKLSGRELEELLTGCLGRFYALDIFLDDMIAYQYRECGGSKMTLMDSVQHFMERVDFIMNAGSDYQPEESAYFARVFLEAQVNPYTKVRTKRIGLHNVVDMERMLGILGDQTLQICLKHKKKPFAYYILKMDSHKVHYLDITDKPDKNATVRITLSMEELIELKDSKARFASMMVARILRQSKFSSLVKGAVALLSGVLAGRSGYAKGVERRKFDAKNALPKIPLPEGFMEDFAQADGWDPKRYLEIKTGKAGTVEEHDPNSQPEEVSED